MTCLYQRCPLKNVSIMFLHVYTKAKNWSSYIKVAGVVDFAKVAILFQFFFYVCLLIYLLNDNICNPVSVPPNYEVGRA
jgi:hypothetical protein